MLSLLELQTIKQQCPKVVYSDLVDGALVETTLVCVSEQLMLHRPYGPEYQIHIDGANRQLRKMGLVALTEELSGDVMYPDGMRFLVVVKPDSIIPEGGFKQHELVILGTR